VWLRFTIALLFLLTTGVTASQRQLGTHTVSRLNYGLVFKAVDRLDVVTDVWSQAFVVRLPQVDDGVLYRQSRDVDCSLFGETQSCSNIIHLVQYLQNASTRSVLQINETLTSIRRLIRHFDFVALDRNESRVERGLIDLVGDVSHALFGTARDIDILKVTQMLQHYKQRQDALVSAWQRSGDHLASYSKTVNRRLDAMKSMIQLQKQSVQALFTQVHAETSDLSQASSMIATALSRFETFVVLLDHLNSFRSAVEQLAHGLLSPILVPPGDLHRALQAVNSSVQHFSSTLRLLRPRVIQYYRLHDFVALRHDDDLLINLHIPLGPLPIALYLYEVHVFPMPNPDESKHTTILTGLPKYLGYHPLSSYYLEFQTKPDVTMTKLFYLEDSTSVLKPVSRMTCVLALFHDDSSAIHRLCQFAVLTNAIRPDLFALDSKHVMITNMSHVAIHCPDRPARNVSCPMSCRVTVPCRCSLISDFFYVPERVENCRPWTRTTVLHTVNLAFLRNFFHESELAGLFGNTLLKNRMEVLVPRLKILEVNYSHELEIDKQARFDLIHLANLTKNDANAFPSLAHSMVKSWQDYNTGSFDFSFAPSTWRSWGVIFIGFLAIISFGFSLLLSYKLRILSASVTALSLPGRAHSLPTALNYFSSTPAPLNSTNIFSLVLKMLIGFWIH